MMHLIGTLGALDGLSQDEQKTYKAILKDLSIQLAEDDRTHKAIREVVLNVADKYKGVSIDAENGIITIKFPNARYKFSSENVKSIASKNGVRLAKKKPSWDEQRLAIAKFEGFWLEIPLGDLPTVRRKGRFKITPPEVYDYNDFDSKTTKRILKKIADKQDYFLKKWHETHKKK